MIILSNIRLLNFDWLTNGTRVLDLYGTPSIAGHGGFFLTMLRNFEKEEAYRFIVVPDTAEIRDLLDRENVSYIRLTVVDGYDYGSNLMTHCNVYAREHNRKLSWTNSDPNLNNPAFRNRIVTLAALSTLCNSMAKPKEFINAVSGLFGYTIAQHVILKNTTERSATAADVMANDLLRYYETYTPVIPKIVFDEVTKKYGRTMTYKFYSYEDLATAAAATKCYTTNLREAFDMKQLNEEYGPLKGPEEE